MLLNKNKQCLLNRRTSGPGSLPPCMPALPWTELRGIRWNNCRWKLNQVPYMAQSTYIWEWIGKRNLWKPWSLQSCLDIGSLVGWGLTESNFTSDGLKEVEVQPFLTFPFFWSIFSPRNLESPSKGKLWPFIHFRFQSLVKANARQMWRKMDPTLLRECSAQAAPIIKAVARYQI